MNAFIYAAGRALRLGPEYADGPKIMVKVGGRSLLEWHAMRLAQQGIRQVHVVTGHLNGQITAAFPDLTARYGVQFIEIFNPDFSEGSVVSFLVSLPAIRAAAGRVLLMDGDVFYSGELLRRLVQSREKCCLLLDRDYSTSDDDPVLVPVVNGRPVDFAKKWTGQADTIGESVGFFTVTPDLIGELCRHTERRSRGPGRMESYDEVLRDLVRQNCFGHEDITGLAWTEIDFPKDLAYARDTVHPAIEKHELETN